MIAVDSFIDAAYNISKLVVSLLSFYVGKCFLELSWNDHSHIETDKLSLGYLTSWKKSILYFLKVDIFSGLWPFSGAS